MNPLPPLSERPALVWTLLGTVDILLFFCAIALILLAFHQHHYRTLCLTIPVLVLSYLLFQCTAAYLSEESLSGIPAVLTTFFLSGHGLFMLALDLAAAAAEWQLFRFLARRAANQITPFSIKEATDNLPAGICFFQEDGGIILANRMMVSLCRRTVGNALINGKLFYEALSSGRVLPGCHLENTDGRPLIVLPDSSAWSFSLREFQDNQTRTTMMLAADVTEVFEKTRTLRQAQEEVNALNRRLTEYNHEIVALTTAREILNAKILIHDALGSNLLAIRRCLLEGGTEKERMELLDQLQLNVDFLKGEQEGSGRDEYTLMLETARSLGVHVQVDGTPPAEDPARHILAVAVHECFTNTLRHARGSNLFVRIREENEWILAELSNDGTPPQDPVREKGGLGSLRSLTEHAGGSMTIRHAPEFAVILRIPAGTRPF